MAVTVDPRWGGRAAGGARRRADVRLRNGPPRLIDDVIEASRATKFIDWSGLLVLPCSSTPHTHFELVLDGQIRRETTSVPETLIRRRMRVTTFLNFCGRMSAARARATP